MRQADASGRVRPGACVTDPLSFVVLGRPQPAGSKKAFAVRRGGELTGRVAVVDDAKHSRSWKHDVAVVARQAVAGAPVLEGPLDLDVVFVVARPKGHYGTGRNLRQIRASAPALPTVKPDVTKLLRAVEDALTGVIYRDDAQIVKQHAEKHYGWPERAEVTIRPLTREQARVLADWIVRKAAA